MVSAPFASLHEQVIERLGSRIVSGEIPEGTVLIAEELGLSRSALRECVRVLETLGLVHARRKRGTVVQPEAVWDVLNPKIIAWRLAGPDRLRQLRSLSELRLGIEPVAARLASERATPEQCGALTAAIVGMAATQRSADHEEYLTHDKDFHRILLEASGNPAFAALSDAVAEALAGRTVNALMPGTANPEAIRLHEEVAVSVRSGEGQRAEAAMRAIVEEADGAMQALTRSGS
ncbi:FCD domain-containing protein [Lysinibacter sp. HNR]|uniref:FadR/GntR family transcriptional regulator n=1 Tax=Lysinibacter sp. HNR TaxID=3031408 RepID=UPI002435BB1F|nr:FCD domain-containing protein [Lysinibacter sp. HNR]WGD36779.1 FCD domain-containing protein [Lysinibacter sp. HNR]